MNVLTKSALSTICVTALVCGCASVRGTPEAIAQKGVVQESVVVPKTNRYWNRDYAGAMGGALGLLMVDAFYEDPQHFAYTVLLDGGRTITVRNKVEVPVGACLSLWLKPDPQSREGHYPLKFNDIEQSTGCSANPPINAPSNAK